MEIEIEIGMEMEMEMKMKLKHKLKMSKTTSISWGNLLTLEACNYRLSNTRDMWGQNKY